MDILYTLLMDIYDYLSMTTKKKMTVAFNMESLNGELEYDMRKRYNNWIANGKPKISSKMTENDAIYAMRNYGTSCLTQMSMINVCMAKYEMAAIEMIDTFPNANFIDYVNE